MRLFFALEPDAKSTMAIADWRDRNLTADGRAVPPANFHITLAFIGETQKSVLPELYEAVDRRLARTDRSPFNLTLDQVGYWPKSGIYWLGPSVWPTQLNDLAEDLRNIASWMGGKRERKRLQPHITLFRRVETPPRAPVTAPHIELALNGFSLFESRQGKQGVIYVNLCDWGFDYTASS